MLGQATASLEPIPRRWVQQVWGYPGIHSRQKWNVLWPYLDQLPRHGLRLLDAGCGRGSWCFELAARRPHWNITGIDRDEESTLAAERANARLGLSNVSFATADFSSFHPKEPFDVVLSVTSAHYATEAGSGTALFRLFRSWLKPEGLLLLLGPRQATEAPFVSWLPRPRWHDIFSGDDLKSLCAAGGLTLGELRGCIGRPGTLAKQLAWAVQPRPWYWSVSAYPLQWLLSLVDTHVTLRGAHRTLMWILVAEASAGGAGR